MNHMNATEELKSLLRKMENLRKPGALEAIERIHSEAESLAEESVKIEARRSEIALRMKELEAQFNELCGKETTKMARRAEDEKISEGLEELFNKEKVEPVAGKPNVKHIKCNIRNGLKSWTD
jgi:hypothetical protein